MGIRRRSSRARALWSRLGRRGVFLLFLALLDFDYAINIAFPAPQAARSAAIKFIAGLLPLTVWAAVWLLVGLVCLVGAFMRRDQWAFACASALKMLWGSVFTFAWLFGGLDRGWAAGAVWLAFALIVMFVISPWPEATTLERARDRAYARVQQ